eukprot:UN28289
MGILLILCLLVYFVIDFLQQLNKLHPSFFEVLLHHKLNWSLYYKNMSLYEKCKQAVEYFKGWDVFPKALSEDLLKFVDKETLCFDKRDVTTLKDQMYERIWFSQEEDPIIINEQYQFEQIRCLIALPAINLIEQFTGENVYRNRMYLDLYIKIVLLDQKRRNNIDIIKYTKNMQDKFDKKMM